MGKQIDEIDNYSGEDLTHVTCSRCASFIDYENGRGWCATFNNQARSHQRMVNDCILNGAIALAPPAEEDKERSEYQIGDRIKAIEAEVHHASWSEYVIEDIFFNQDLYRTSSSYLNEARWYYRICDRHNRRLWLAENQICLANQSNLISTEDIF